MAILLPVFKALADETRLRMFNVLLAYELNVRELETLFEMGQSRVSRHLKVLADAGLLTSRRDGLWVFYAARREGESRKLLDALADLFSGDPELELDLRWADSIFHERAQETRRFFDAVAGKWDQLSREILGGFDLAAEILARTPECGSIVDLGCGTGELLQALSVRSSYLIGVDSSPRMIEMARKRFAEGRAEVSLRIGELEHLPLRDGEAEFAVCCMALHHLSDPRRALQEACRTLRPASRLVVADLVKHRNEALRFAHGDRWLGFEDAELGAWLRQAGFIIDEWTRYEVNIGLSIQLVTAHKGSGQEGQQLEDNANNQTMEG